MSINELLALAKLIRDEQKTGANTHFRIGTTLEEIIKAIPSNVLTSYDDTEPSDATVFSALRTILEVTTRSISKTEDDTAEGIITFLKGLKSDEIASIESSIGALGTGFRLWIQDGKSNLEIDKLTVRSGILTDAQKSVLALLEKDSTGKLKIDADVYSTGALSAYGAGSTEPSGGATSLGQLVNVEDSADDEDAAPQELVKEGSTWNKKLYDHIRKAICNSNGLPTETNMGYLSRVTTSFRYVGLSVVLKRASGSTYIRYEFMDGIQDSNFVEAEYANGYNTLSTRIEEIGNTLKNFDIGTY